MKRFDFEKLRADLQKTCDKLYVVRDEIYDKRRDIESLKNTDEEKETILILNIEEEHINELLCHLEEAINELEWHTCE